MSLFKSAIILSSAFAIVAFMYVLTRAPHIAGSFSTIAAEARALEKNIRDLQYSIQKSQYQQRDLMMNFFTNLDERDIRAQVARFEELLARNPGLYAEGFLDGYFGRFSAGTLMTFREQDRRRLEGIERPETVALIDLLPLASYNSRLSDIASKISKSL